MKGPTLRRVSCWKNIDTRLCGCGISSLYSLHFYCSTITCVLEYKTVRRNSELVVVNFRIQTHYKYTMKLCVRTVWLTRWTYAFSCAKHVYAIFCLRIWPLFYCKANKTDKKPSLSRIRKNCAPALVISMHLVFYSLLYAQSYSLKCLMIGHKNFYIGAIKIIQKFPQAHNNVWNPSLFWYWFQQHIGDYIEIEPPIYMCFLWQNKPLTTMQLCRIISCIKQMYLRCIRAKK